METINPIPSLLSSLTPLPLIIFSSTWPQPSNFRVFLKNYTISGFSKNLILWTPPLIHSFSPVQKFWICLSSLSRPQLLAPTYILIQLKGSSSCPSSVCPRKIPNFPVPNTVGNFFSTWQRASTKNLRLTYLMVIDRMLSSKDKDVCSHHFYATLYWML